MEKCSYQNLISSVVTKILPRPMCYLVNHRENRYAWVDYHKNLEKMPHSMKTSIVTSPFHKYMKYMYETYNEIK